MKKRLAATVAAATLAGGGVIGVAVVSMTGAGAQTGASSTTTTTVPAHKGQDRTKSALDPLVKDGTITQSQEDKVIAALEKDRPKGGKGGPGFGGPGRGMGLGFGVELNQDADAIAKVLGITSDELKTDLKGGQSLADIAKAKNVDVNKVISSIVDLANTKIDQAVTDGKLTKDQADKIKADETKIVTDLVNGAFPGKGFGRGPGGFGHGRPGDFGGPDGAPGSSTTAPSTTAPSTTTTN